MQYYIKGWMVLLTTLMRLLMLAAVCNSIGRCSIALSILSFNFMFSSSILCFSCDVSNDKLC